jgi:hypothetical protein
MERIHLLIGLLVWFIFVAVAAGDEVLTKDERIVALTLLGEARGEGSNGIYAVACVIQKRAKERYKTPAEVCLQPWQFSIWNAGKGKVKKESELYYLWDSKCDPVKYSRLMARTICGKWNLAQGFTGHANHYYSTDRKTPPYWTFDKKTKKPIKPTMRIGKHIFYKLP